MRFGSDICANLDEALQREWLETNGIGGFGSSTIAGVNTRRYHGLLTASLHPPVARHVLLSKFEETLIIDGRRYDLSANRYPGAVHPRGFEYLEEFRLDPWPVFRFRVEDVVVEKSLFMVQGENTVAAEYALLEGRAGVALELRPLIAFRDYHSTTHANGSINGDVTEAPGVVAISPYQGLPALHFAHNASAVERTGSWYYNFEYDRERERGLDCSEDLFNPFVASFSLPARVIVSTEARDVEAFDSMRESERYRRAAVRARSPLRNDLVEALTAAADQYIVQRGEGKTVIAGYHWFSDWGRDTMIALPGLTLVTGQFDVARHILLEFVRHADQGMLPNRFPDGGESPEYNTVDATLWLFEAVRSYVQYTDDIAFVRERLYTSLAEIIDWHVRGTRYGIRVDADGLLNAGVNGAQLTWMDAKIGDWVVTPRHGKPVEIQALWYNALRVMESFAHEFGDTSGESRYRAMAAVVCRSFNEQFWNDGAGCLRDVDGDDSIRPNQIIAVGLTHSMLDKARAKRVVQSVERELLTPLGLRSLAPSDPRYRPQYLGDGPTRDASYHQGTVWPWLMGPFLTAYVKVNNGSKAARGQAEEWLDGFADHLSVAGLGHISEIADADPPHAPRGCIAQAWSVAEVLRAAVEDVYAGSSKPGMMAAIR